MGEFFLRILASTYDEASMETPASTEEDVDIRDAFNLVFLRAEVSSYFMMLRMPATCTNELVVLESLCPLLG